MRTGLGCQRLSEPGVDRERAIDVVGAALDAGIRWFDTANVYAPSAATLGHNESLLAEALRRWDDRAEDLVVATKGGLSRYGRRWIPEGRAGRLRAACEASLKALDRETIDLYQLHALDRRVDRATTFRALAKLLEEGLVSSVGLCNVRVDDIEAALDLVPVRTVQVAISPFELDALKGGVVELCVRRGLRVLAHSPLGGQARRSRLERCPPLDAIAREHDASVEEVALAWLLAVLPDLMVLPGATSPSTVSSIRRAEALELDERDLARLDESLPAGSLLRRPREERKRSRRGAPPNHGASFRATAGWLPAGDAEPTATTRGEVVLLMGSPAAGKTRLSRRWTDRGFVRLNRDERGGRLADLLPELERLLAERGASVVLDNTYATRASRFDVLETAWRHGATVRCVFLDTPLAQSQVNAVRRMLSRHGRLLRPEEMKGRRVEIHDFGPEVLFRYRRQLEPPGLEEGFDSLETVPFEPADDATVRSSGAAHLFDLGDLVSWAPKGARSGSSTDQDVAIEALELLPGRQRRLEDLAARGEQLAVATYLPEAGAMSEAGTARLLDRVRTLASVPLEIAFCPHPPGPSGCWCRKPLPGLGVELIDRLGLDPARCTVVGRGAANRSFAAALGMSFLDADRFF